MKTVWKIAFVGAMLLLVMFVASAAWTENNYNNERATAAAHLKQLNEGDASLTELKRAAHHQSVLLGLGKWLLGIGGVGYVVYKMGGVMASLGQGGGSKKAKCGKGCSCACAALLLTLASGCQTPFEPNQLEVIQSNEYAFLLPFTEDVAKQVHSQNEEYLKKNMVFAKQVRVPQQWVQTGYAWFGRNAMNGSWKPAAMLIRVTNSPVTREWTADPMSGTGNKNEAVWVMTADQVEFSTGWSCTGRIASEENAVKFLHNYPNGTLEKVLDSEVRMKLATEFAMEVTDLPMEKLRKDATPHIKSTVQRVTEFFSDRGITITNLGITGGFVYKDASVQEMLVKVFNAEQQKALAIAATQAQEETNKKIQLEATGKAEARLKESKAEAEAIKLVADAKEYELTKARDNIETYLALKRLEIEGKKIEKWSGKYPETYFGEKPPELMLSVPQSK